MKKVLIVVVILLALGFVYMMIQAQEKASRSLESQVPDTKVYQKVDLEEGPDLSSYDGEYFLDVDASTLGWSGAKVVGGGHEGVVTASSGNIAIENGKLLLGEMVIDMTTISSTDLEGETKEKLDSHLKASDFFDVENHPTAMVDVFGATRAPGSPHDTYQFDAQMTILDVSNSLDFVGQLEDRDGSLVLTTSFIINKDDFGIGSGFKGAAIKDEIEFEVSVLFSKEK